MKAIDAIFTLKDAFTPTLKHISKEASAHEIQQQKLAKAVKKTAKTFDNFAEKATIAMAPLMGVGYKIFQEWSKASEGFAKAETILDTTKYTTEQLHETIKTVSFECGKLFSETSEVMYQAMSAGVTDMQDAAMVAREVFKGTQAGFADSKNMIKLITTAMTTCKISAQDASKIVDKLILSQKIGVLEAGELAESFTKIMQTASLAGLSIDEMLASMVLLTQSGQSVPIATTNFQALLNSIISPTAQAKKAAEEFGIDFSLAGMRAAGGYLKFMQEINKKTGGEIDKLGKIFTNSTALSAATTLIAKAEDLEETVNKLKFSEGEALQAFEKMDTPARKMEFALNNLQNSMVEFGQIFGPILVSLSVGINKAAKYFNDLDQSTKDFIVTAGILLVSFVTISATVMKIGYFIGGLFDAYSKFNGAFKALTGLASANPYVLALIAIIALIALVVANFDWVKNEWEYLMKCCDTGAKRFKDAVTAIGAAIGFFFLGSIKLIVWIIAGILKGIIWLFKKLGEGIAAVWHGIVAIVKWEFNLVYSIIKFIIHRIQASFSFMADFMAGLWNSFVTFFENTPIGKNLIKLFTEIIPNAFSATIKVMKAGLNSVIDLLNGIRFTVPEWVPQVGGKEYSFNIPKLFTGAENWAGGRAMLHDQGPEIVDLPNGARVIPHARSLREAEAMGRAKAERHGDTHINIAKMADSIVVREEADIDRIAQAFVDKLKIQGINRMEGALT